MEIIFLHPRFQPLSPFLLDWNTYGICTYLRDAIEQDTEINSNYYLFAEGMKEDYLF